MRGSVVAVLLAVLSTAGLSAAGCGVQRLDAPVATAVGSRELPPGDAELWFGADFSEQATGALVEGTSVRVSYDPARLPQCRGWKYGMPAWAITAFWRIDGGDVHTLPVVMSDRLQEVWIDLDRAGELEVWFGNNDAFGCNAWDSDYGANYRFDVAPAADGPVIPAWMGDAASVISRQTCDDGGFCDADLRALDQGFTYDTWARQRATVAFTTFQAWAPGVTDPSADRDQVWQLLDARIHWAPPDADPTTGDELGWDYVDVHDFVGNDVRYAYPLRELDPLGGGTVTDPADCPEVPIAVTPDGQYVEAQLAFWFSVNGAELRPASGAWIGTFRDYVGLYGPCLTP